MSGASTMCRPLRHTLFSAVLLGMSVAVLGPVRVDAAPAQDTLTFGIVPQQSASRLARMWSPFLAELSERMGVEVEFRTTKDIPTFEACLAEGAYDIAYMNPMHYAIFSAESGYQAFARQADKRLKGVIVVRKDADIDQLEGLDQAEIAFPSPGAFGASILTRSTLNQRGVVFTPTYVNSHDSVYRAVSSGLMKAGGGVARTLGALDPNIQSELRVVYETPGFTAHAFGANANMNPAEVARFSDVFLAIAEERPDLIKALGMSGFETAHDADWDDVRALEMSREDSGILRQGQTACPSG